MRGEVLDLSGEYTAMHGAKVMVVDDSAAMRALFCDILEQAPNVTVVGTAASAEAARDQITQLRPNVLTLDVEMPGMSGIEFLEEIMSTNPLPVVMLSGLTQSGTEVSLKAYDLGAVECFPKPLKATPEQFAKDVSKLGKIVLAAANSNVRDRPRRRANAASASPFVWNGRIAAFSASMGGIDALTDILSHWPANCPPTIITLQAEPALVDTLIARLDRELGCAVRAASDGSALEQGTVLFAADPGKHAVFEAGQPPRIRLIERDAIDGVRPSANLLFGTIARAGVAAAGAVLTGLGEDGAKGLKMMRDAGCDTFAQDRASATVSQAPAAAIAMGGAGQELALDAMIAAILKSCSAG
jgi:two-component system chemotaxis response regulator CheB